jgi:hypothetical protein
MKITGSVTKVEDVEISASEMRRIALHMHKIVYGYDYTHHFIDKSGNLMRIDEYHTSHSLDEEVKIRKATANDIEAVSVMGKFKKGRI